MKNYLLRMLSFVFAAVLTGMLMGGPALGQDADSAKVARVLNESKLTFTKQSETVWVTPFEGKNLKDIPIVMSVGGDILVVFTLVAQKKEVNMTPALMLKLLAANQEFDRVKVGIDKDGDIFTRIDIPLRVLDAAELRTSAEQTSAVADQIFAYVQPSLVKKK